jgi:flagellar basal-body rod protein FlgG
MTSLYSSGVTGLKAQQTRLDSVANNLANIATPGYRATRVDLAARAFQPLEVARAGDGSEPPTEIGGGVDIAGTTRSFTMGGLQMTGRPTDLAILGDNGFFRVMTPDGRVAYTRDGSFSFDAQGRLVTSAGDAVEPPVQVAPGTTLTGIMPDGRVLGTPPGAATPQVLGLIQLAQFVNPNGLELIGGNRYVATEASGLPTIGAPGSGDLPEIGAGVLETSNVDLVEQTTTMIEAQRAYSMNLRSLQTLDEMLGMTVQLRS